MLKRLRITVLLYIALLVALGQWLAAARSTDWNATLWVDVYPLAGDASAATPDYVNRLTVDEFDGIEKFLASEARRYGVTLERPFRLTLAPPIDAVLPQLPAEPSILQTMWWSLRMRWFAARLEWNNPRPAADIVVFAVYHDGATIATLDRSMALEKGLIAVANLFANRAARGSNQVVLAHELLHTLGASDKYAAATNLPRFPEGYAAPTAEPLLPQTKAELMAGRIPIAADSAETPTTLQDVVIGALTATEIGWLR
jgi:hypothetical protein